MQNLISSFKKFNNKHKKLVPFIIYFEIFAILIACIFKGIRKNIKIVVLIALIIAAIVFALGHLRTSKRPDNSPGKEIVETISVEEMMAVQERSAESAISTDSVSAEISKEAVDSSFAEGSKEAVDSSSTEVSEEAVDRSSTEVSEESADNASSEVSIDVTDAASDEQSEGQEIVVSSEQSEDQENVASSENSSVAKAAILPKEGIAKFIAEYPDTVAWLLFEDDRLSYPIMQADDNSKYAIKDYEGNDSDTGALFLDYRATADFNDANSIIYGHNMRNRTYFGALRTYKEDLGFLENHKYFQIITPEGTRRYMIFAFMDVPKNSYIYDVVGANPENMREFLDTIEYKTYIDTGIEPTVDDKIITLSTCTKKDSLFFVMFAVEVE